MKKKIITLALCSLRLAYLSQRSSDRKCLGSGYPHSVTAKLTLGPIFNSFKKILILLGLKFYGS